MLKKKYDDAIREKIELTRQLTADLSPLALRELKKLLRVAKQMNDHALLGYCYYYISDVYYTSLLDYNKYRLNLREAVRHLLRSDEAELLARAYNFVGIDAINMGCFDIAYNYFMTALRVVESEKNSVVTGIALSNIAHIYYQLGQLKEARATIRKSRRISTPKNDDIYFYRNLAVDYYSEGLICLEMGLLKEAAELDRKIQELIRKSDGKAAIGNEIPLAFFRIMLHHRSGHKKTTEKLIADLSGILKHKTQIFDYIEDVHGFCMYMLSVDRPDVVKTVLSQVTENMEASGVIYMQRIIMDIRLAYYEKLNNRRMVNRLLREQYTITEKAQSIQKELYLYSMDLIRMSDDVRKEQKKIREENRTLMIQARTDALTGIPNRYELSQRFDEALRNARANRSPLTLCIMDIDQFKQYNDTYGHPMGDLCLEKVASTLMEFAKLPGISCARYGGDEFVVIAEGYSRERIPEFARQFEDIISDFNIEHKASSISNRVTISQGICYGIPKKTTRYWDYLSRADEQLYKVKESHKKKKKGKSSPSILMCDL